jgi:hypothetical protein
MDTCSSTAKIENRTSPNSSPNCVPQGLQIRPWAPLYSIENKRTATVDQNLSSNHQESSGARHRGHGCLRRHVHIFDGQATRPVPSSSKLEGSGVTLFGVREILSMY